MPRLKIQNNFIFYDKHNNKIDNHKVERIEQCFAERYIYENDVVLELGARYGTVSCAINSKLKNKKNQVSVEPDNTVWEALENNKNINNCEFHIVKGFISNKKLLLNYNDYGSYSLECKNKESDIPSFTLEEIKKKNNLNFNVLVADCEGFLEKFLSENEYLYDDLDMIQFEEDRSEICNYKNIKKKLNEKGFKCIAYRGYMTPQCVFSKSDRTIQV